MPLIFSMVCTSWMNAGKMNLEKRMVTLKGSTWSSVRATVAPAFSTAKIRQMIPTLNESSQICVKILKDYAKKGEKVPIRETMVRVMLDMTSKAAFGRDFNVQHDEQSTFIDYAKKYAEFDFRSPRIVAITLFPNLCWVFKKLTGYSILNNETNRYFVEILDHLYENRIDNKENYDYKDFFQLMLSAMKEEDKNREIDREIEFEITGKSEKSSKGIKKQHIFGQAFMFILAGFETGPINLHLTVYMLAMHEEWQERVRNEIESVLNGKEPDYVSLAELPLLEQCIHETQRLFPAVVRLNRMCTKPVELNGILMPKGSVFSIPVYNIHHSEKFYENPEEFRPERWSPEEKAKRDPLTFLPFGHGPRNCIGMRVGQFQMRSVLVHLLRHFRLTIADGSPKTLPLEIDTRGSFRTVSPLYINVETI
ncbi:unnamed protein product, partial [Mesorhabditis belari]|uniref:Cytochrome P450 n=1 Tax=Mesorhabditis belari TaxID=2138241 RepID=A0AAF3JAD3_9BILA